MIDDYYKDKFTEDLRRIAPYSDAEIEALWEKVKKAKWLCEAPAAAGAGGLAVYGSAAGPAGVIAGALVGYTIGKFALSGPCSLVATEGVGAYEKIRRTVGELLHD